MVYLTTKALRGGRYGMGSFLKYFGLSHARTWFLRSYV